MKRQPLPRNPEPIFHCFDVASTNSDACLDQLYAAFIRHRPAWNWCRQCFTPETEDETRRQPNPRGAPAASFAHIYYEHPNCSGGRETFLHWLPRGLTLFLLDPDFDSYASFLEVMVRLTPWRWSFDEQDAVRTLLCRAAIGWFKGGDPAPLRLEREAQDQSCDGGVSETLVRALLALRVNPFDLFTWLARIGGQRAYEVLLDLAIAPRLTEDPTYFVLDDEADAAIQHAALDALDRLARDALTRIVIGHDRARRLWAWAERSDPMMARSIAETEAVWRDRLRRSSPMASAADRVLVTAAIG